MKDGFLMYKENTTRVFGAEFFVVAAILALAAGLRTPGFDRDSLQYLAELNRTFSEIDLSSKEPAFWLLQQLNLRFFASEYTHFFLMFAACGVSIKLLSISILSKWRVWSVFVYIALFFVMHEMTQIRAGVAIGLVFLSSKFIIERRLSSFLVLIFLASLFHYSAIVFCFLYFVRSNFNFKIFCAYAALPALALVVNNLRLPESLVGGALHILPEFLSYKIELYLKMAEANELEVVNPLNFGNIAMLFIVLYAGYMLSLRDKSTIELREHALYVAFKWNCIGYFILFSLSFIEVFAYRWASYMLFPMVVTLPYAFSRLRPKKLGAFVFGAFLIYFGVRSVEELLS